MNNNKYLISVVEASQRYGLGRDFLYSLVRSREDMPIIKINGITKINVVLFEEWLNKITLEEREL